MPKPNEAVADVQDRIEGIEETLESGETVNKKWLENELKNLRVILEELAQQSSNKELMQEIKNLRLQVRNMAKRFSQQTGQTIQETTPAPPLTDQRETPAGEAPAPPESHPSPSSQTTTDSTSPKPEKVNPEAIAPNPGSIGDARPAPETRPKRRWV